MLDCLVFRIDGVCQLELRILRITSENNFLCAFRVVQQNYNKIKNKKRFLKNFK
jgi:hypothetical protein